MKGSLAMALRPHGRLAVLQGGDVYRSFIPVLNKFVEGLPSVLTFTYLTYGGRKISLPFDERTLVIDFISFMMVLHSVTMPQLLRFNLSEHSFQKRPRYLQQYRLL